MPQTKTPQKDRTLETITHAMGIFSSLFGALLVYLLTQDKEAKNHSIKALNWQISLLIYTVLILTSASLFALVTSLFARTEILLPLQFFYSVFTVVNIVFCIMAAHKAHKGILWNYPLSLNIIQLIDTKNAEKARREVRKAAREIKREVSKEFKKKNSPKKKAAKNQSRDSPQRT